MSASNSSLVPRPHPRGYTAAYSYGTPFVSKLAPKKRGNMVESSPRNDNHRGIERFCARKITTVTTVTNYHGYHCYHRYQLPLLPPLPITTVTTVTSYHRYQLPQLPPLPITAVVIIPWARFNHIAPFFLKQMAFHIL